MSLSEALSSAAGGFESAASIAAEIDKHDGLMDNAPELWKRIMTVLRIPKDIAPDKMQKIKKAFSYALYGPDAEKDRTHRGHASGRRRLFANALLRAKPWDFCNLAIALLAASSAGPPEVKDYTRALKDTFTTQIARMQTETKEKLPVMKPLEQEKVQTFVESFGKIYKAIEDDVHQNFDPKDVATQSALRFFVCNASCPVKGGKILEDGYAAHPQFEPLIKERVGLRPEDGLDPGAFVNETEKQECINELKAGKALHDTEYYRRYSRVAYHILKSEYIKKMRELTGDQKGGMHDVEMILNSEAPQAEKDAAIAILVKNDISLIGHISPESFAWSEYEKVYHPHKPGEKVPLNEATDPALARLLA